MKFILSLLLAFHCTTIVFSQEINRYWKDFKEGSGAERVRACNELMRYYHSESHDSIRYIGEEMFAYGIQEHYYPAIEMGKLSIAEYLIQHGRATEAIALAKTVLPAIEERGDDRTLCSALRIISQGYTVQRDGYSSLFWAKKSLEAGKRNADPIVKVEGLQPLAEAYVLNGKLDLAIETMEKFAQGIKPFKKYRTLSSVTARLGDVYRSKGRIDKAEEYFRLSMKYANFSNRTTPVAHALNNLAIIDFERGDTVNARTKFYESLLLRLKIKDPIPISESYYNMGDYHFYIGQSKKALYWYTKSLKYSERNSLKPQQKDALTALAEVSKSIQDYKATSEYLELSLALAKEINTENSADDQEIDALQRKMIILEKKENVKPHERGKKSALLPENLKWEWFVIGILALALLFMGVMRKK